MRRTGYLDADGVIIGAGHWEMRAEEMRALAEEASDPAVRAMMLRMAADYERLAKWAEEEGRPNKAAESNPLRTSERSASRVPNWELRDEAPDP
jgi:hypothetical protein